jgi:hypothetical protein
LAKLPRHPARHLSDRVRPPLGPRPRRLRARRAGAACIAASILILALPAPASERLDLVGTWYVLVHFTDANTAHPEAVRWDDRIWVFERKGSKLEWREYPIVVFADETGRFEALGTSRQARVVAPWEPNEAQRAQIEGGLEINTRGMKSKALRGSDEAGWRSASRAGAASASVITYTENWSIEGLPERPVFSREDVMGSARSESLEGLTRYATTEVAAGGAELSGSFVRDGTRQGTFRMRRAAPVTTVKGSGKTQGQRLMDAWLDQFGAALIRGDDEALGEDWKQRLEAGEALPPELQQELRKEIRRNLESTMRARKIDPDEQRERLDRLTDAIYREMVENGRSAEEVGEMIESGRLPL